MNDVVHISNDNISWVIGIFFWVVILIGVVVFVRSAFKAPKE